MVVVEGGRFVCGGVWLVDREVGFYIEFMVIVGLINDVRVV